MKQIPQSNRLYNYKMVDLIKFIAAFLVICIHCSDLIPNAYVNYLIKNVLCRIAVPYFFVSTAYFVRKNSQEKSGYFKQYLKGLTKSYLLWSLFFIPLGIAWIHQNLDLPLYLYPVALIFGFVYIGTYYHLWYITALLFSLVVIHQLLKKYSYKALFILFTLLFILGSSETYYGILPAQIKEIVDSLIMAIFTLRNGLLFGAIFVLIGFFIYDYRERLLSLKKYFAPLSILFGIGLFLEGSFLYTVQRLDMNFLLFLLPFSFVFFLWTLTCSVQIKKETTNLRLYAKYYYFIHPLLIFIVMEAGANLQNSFFTEGVFSFLLIVLLTHATSYVMIWFIHYVSQENYFKNNKVGLTIVLAHLFSFCISVMNDFFS